VVHRRALLLAGLTAVWPQILTAQSPDQTKENADQSVRVGDRWIYRMTDQLKGQHRDAVVAVIGVSDKGYGTFQTVGGYAGRFYIFDHDWNVTDDSVDTFKPNDGRGVRLPLAIGEKWQTKYDSQKSGNETVKHGLVQSKVTGQESATTMAGTFETFRVEHNAAEFKNNGTTPSDKSEEEIVIWYAPQINRWVRRTVIIRAEKQIRTNLSWELVGFLRKP
jgi:hypothetical protein